MAETMTVGSRSELGARVRGALTGPLEPFLPLLGLFLLQRILFPAPMGVVLNGALVGGRIALIALGIALVYRANRIINFAQGDLGGVPATLGVMLIVSWGWSYWFGLAAGLLAALVLGVLVDTLIIQRFSKAPRLVLTVATLGISQLLIGGSLLLPRAFGDKSFAPRIDPPFSATWEFGGTIFNGNDIVTMAVVPVAFVLLALFLQRSTVGIAIVGAAERSDRALTLGIPVKRLQTVVWAVASVLAFLAMFLRAGQVGLPIGEVLFPTFLVQALGAAVFGRFERFTTIAFAAIGLGIVDQSMTFQAGNRPAYNDAVLFGIVLVGLLLTRRTGTGRVDADASTWQATREVRPIPRELVRLPEVRFGRIGLWTVLGTFALTLPVWASTANISLATVIVLFGIMAASLVVLSGWAGQVSLGHMAFVAVGAAVGGALTQDRNWDLGVTMLVAGLAGAFAAVVVGYPALRRRGMTLAVSTLAFALFVSSYMLNGTIFDWLPDDRVPTPTLLGSIEVDTETRLFYVSLAVLLLAMAMVTGMRRSRTGRVLIAIRENEKAAQAYGVNAIRTSLAAFAFSGFLAAVAGSLYIHQQVVLESSPYVPQRSLELFSMVVIGGLGSLPGAILGAAYVKGADNFLPLEWQFLASGAGLLLVLLIFPSGLGAVMAELRDMALRWVAKRRGIIVPSLLADVRVQDEPDPPLAPDGAAAHAADDVQDAVTATDADGADAAEAGATSGGGVSAGTSRTAAGATGDAGDAGGAGLSAETLV
jgi:branched-chain amino acid transport system permease protein